MKLHELLNYIRPTQPIRVVVPGWDEDYITVIEETPYNEITLMKAYNFMQGEVTGIDAVDSVLEITLTDEDYDGWEDY